MICEKCQGIGYSPQPTVTDNGHLLGLPSFEPCPDCQGIGISYCCDTAGANPPNTYEDSDLVKVSWTKEVDIDFQQFLSTTNSPGTCQPGEDQNADDTDPQGS